MAFEIVAGVWRWFAVTAAVVGAFKDKLAEDPKNHIGTWHDAKTGRIVADVVQVYDSRDEAERIGKQADQDGIFDLSKMKTIFLKPPAPLTPRLERRLRRAEGRPTHFPKEKELIAAAIFGSRPKLRGNRIILGRDAGPVEFQNAARLIVSRALADQLADDEDEREDEDMEVITTAVKMKRRIVVRRKRT